MNPFKITFLFLSLSLLVSCSNETTYDGFDGTVTTDIPDKFFQFFNQHSKLSAGFYTIVAASSTPGSTDAYTITIEKNNGESEQVITGSWTSSFGTSTTPWDTCSGDPSNFCTDISISDASGVTITLESNSDNVLYLVNNQDTPTIIREQNTTGAGEDEQIIFSPAQIRETAYSEAYYDVVDNNNNRNTLQGYIALHGFDGTDEVHVTFRDTKDLGYGRDMYMRSYHSDDCGGQQVTAFYVRNFKVDVIKGVSYGIANLDAAIAEDLTYHFGSNAIEFSKGFDSLGETCADEPYNRFFTFKSDYSSTSALHFRLNEVDLDGRGEKAMPQPCISCHGGKARPLDRFDRFVTINANDSINQIGDTKSRLQAFEVDTFQFSNESNKTQSDFEDGLRLLNSAVFCTYPGSESHAACANFGNGQPAQTDNGEWNADFARDMLSGAYSDTLETEGTEYTASYVPDGWQPSVENSVPEGADTLFTKVISPNCFVCHGKRGSALGTNRNESGDGKDIDFSSWAKFVTHSEEIRKLVYEEGRMPLGLLNYNNFWNDPERPALLASFIAANVDDFSQHVADDSSIIKPGLPVAHAGLDRITKLNAPITLNASSSLFIDTYSWSITSTPVGSSATISEIDSSILEFSADTEGSYVLTLTVTNSETLNQATDTITIKVDDLLSKAPRELEFYDDITAELSTCAAECHSPTGIAASTPEAAGIPVWWISDDLQPVPPPLTTSGSASLGFYEQVRTRVNFNNIEDSLFIKKPSSLHHFGALRAGFDADSEVGTLDRDAYDLFVNWISEGAICGGTSAQCPSEN